MVYLPHVLAAFVGYLLGAIPVGFLIARAYGVDIFKFGSGNPGATNVRRALGSRAGNLVFALDALKGAAAAAWPLLIGWIAVRYSPALDRFADEAREVEIGNLWHDAKLEALTGVVAAVLGHSFSVFTKFKGGKGVATAAGGLMVLMPLACGTAAGVWLLAFFIGRYVSLASILAAITVPTVCWLGGDPLPLKVAATVIGVFVVFRHRANIGRLLNGTERKFVKGAAAVEPAAPGSK